MTPNTKVDIPDPVATVHNVGIAKLNGRTLFGADVDAWWDVVDWSYVASNYGMVQVGAKLGDFAN